MNQVTYGVVEEHHALPGRERISYGIEAFLDVEQLELGCIVASVHDLSSDRTEILHLAQTCNRLGVSPEHLEEVVADWMGERYCVHGL